VLRSVCAAEHCGWDPAGDVAAVVARLHDGPDLLNALVAESVAAPDYPGVLDDLHAARRGHAQALERFTAEARHDEAAPAALLSQGLHESTLCLDLASPWDPNQPGVRRAATLASLAAATPRSAFYPFDRSTAIGNGLARGCVEWPPTRPPALSDGSPTARLPTVPVLLLAGEHDLSTPLAWARAEAATAPRGRLLEVPGAGHSVQLRARDPGVRRALAQFLRTG
jgi:pimeloyl-ACP methyl ester carboxylesterase